MKHLKMLGLVATAALGLMALVGVSAAQAAFYTDSGKTVKYATGTVVDLSLKSGSTSRLTNGAETVATCSESTAKGKTSETSETVSVSLETLTWGGCSTTTDTLANGKLEITWTSGSNGEVIGQESKWTVSIFGVSCTYGLGEGVKLGTLVGGETPTLNIAALIPRTAGGALCPSAVTWDAEYVVTEPHALYVGPVLTSLYTDSTVRYSAGTIIDLSLKSGTSATLANTSGETMATCTGSTAKGKAEGETSKATPVNLETLTWSGCPQTTDTVSLGSLELKQIGTEDKGEVVGKGSEVTVGIFGVSCTYGTSEGTKLGTIIGGEAPVLSINVAIPKTAGGFLCPSTGIWKAEYVFTEPHALHFAPAPLTSLYTDSAKTIRYSAGTIIDLSLETGTSATLTNTSGTTIATCTGSTAKGRAEGEVSKATPVNLETLTWTGCEQTTDTVNLGSLELKQVGEKDEGEVVGKNTNVTLGIFGVSCTYGTGEGTKLGTITGGEAPTLKITATINRTAGGFLCPSTGIWHAAYVFTQPHALHFG